MKVEKKLKMLKETLANLSESVETLVESSNTLSEAVDDFNDILEALIEEVEEKNMKDISVEEADKVINRILTDEQEAKLNNEFNKVPDESEFFADVFVDVINKLLDHIIEEVESRCEEQPCCKEEKEAVAFCLKEGDSYTFYPYKSTFTLSRAELLEMLSFEDEEAEFIL